MQRVRQRVVDDLDLRVVQQRGVGVDDPLDTVPGRERLGARPVAGGDGDEPVAGRLRAGPISESSVIRAAPSTPIAGFQAWIPAQRPAFAKSPRRYSTLVRTSVTGPSPDGSPGRIVSCSRTYHPS